MHKERTPTDVLSFARGEGAKLVDLKFIDWPGIWQHFTVPLHEFDEQTFEDGLGFDGSSIRDCYQERISAETISTLV